MTFNVLCSLCSAGYEPWDARVPYMADTIERHAPQLVGLQEVATAEEVAEILAATGGAYEALYWHDDDDAYADALVLYDPTRFSPLESGEYWLSPEPDVAFSTGFSDGFQLARLVVWVRLHDMLSDREILFATTHFDNNSPSQELSAPLLLERTELHGGAEIPTIVVGDFNAQPTDLAYEILTEGERGRGFALQDVFELAKTWSVDTNAPRRPDYAPETRIDHMFVSGAAWASAWWTVDMHTYGPDSLYVSDHFAMAAELSAE
jgi:endonuclease/exonuclease/phosphatase family metal-dependent hydrolase